MENDSTVSKYKVDASDAVGVAIGEHARVVQQIAAVYNIYPAHDGGLRISARLKEQQERLLERHVTFGGRSIELDCLNDALTGRSAGYALVTAAAGFGKTALLANWIQSLRKASLPVCYSFISLDGFADEDFNLRNLCQQLVAYHDLCGILPTSTSELRSLFPRLLEIPAADGQNVIVVMDGLDEAADWLPVFPKTLAQGVFVILSARELPSRNWIHDLSLRQADVNCLTLKPLDIQQIASVLSATGGLASMWTNDDSFLQAVYDISQGDPFYVHFLAEDIAGGGIKSIDEIRKQPTGLNAYLDKWWDEVSQRVSQRAVRDLLGYLVVAKGPLTRDDLTNVNSDDELNGFTFEHTVREIRRFLVADEATGFSLCHPRFRDYLAQKRIKEPDQRPYLTSLLGYCSRWRAHKSRYALTHYCEHLFELGQYDALYAVINNPWREEQSRKSFVRDLDLALKAARNEQNPNLVQEARACLVYANLRAASERMPLANLACLTRIGKLEQALDMAALTSAGGRWTAKTVWATSDRARVTTQLLDVDRRVTALRLVGEALLKQGQEKDARNVLIQALNVANSIRPVSEETSEESEDRKTIALAALAVPMSRLGELDRLLSVAGTTQENSRADCLSEIALALGKARQTAGESQAAKQGLSSASDLEEGEAKAQTLGKLAFALAEGKDIVDAIAVSNDALRIAGDIENLHTVTLVRAAVARALLITGDSRRSVETVNSALDAIEAISDLENKSEALADAAELLIRAGGRAQIVKLAHRVRTDLKAIEQDEAKIVTQINVTRVLAIAGEFGQANEVAKEIEKTESRSMAYQRLVDELVNAKEYDEAVRIAEGIEEDDFKYDSMRTVACALAEERLFDQAHRVSRGIEDYVLKVEVLNAIVQGLADTGDIPAATKIACEAMDAATELQSIEDGRWKADALIDISKALVRTGELSRAIEVAENVLPTIRRQVGELDVEDESNPIKRLCEVASIMMGARQRDKSVKLVPEILSVVRGYPSAGRDCEEALHSVSSVLVELDELHKLVEQAEGHEDPHWRNLARKVTGQILAQRGQGDRAVRMVEEIGDKDLKAEALGIIAQTLANADWDAALAAAKEIKDGFGQAMALALVATASGDSGKTLDIAGQLEAHLDDIANEPEKVSVLTAVAIALERANEHSRALRFANVAGELIERVDDNLRKVYALVELAQCQSIVGEHVAASRAANRAMELAATVENSQRAEAFRNAAIAVAHCEPDSVTLLNALRAIGGDEEDKRDALISMVQAFAEDGNFDLAFRATLEFGDDSSRATAILVIGRSLTNDQEREWQRLTADALAIGNIDSKIKASIGLAKIGVQTGRGDSTISLLRAAFASAESLERPAMFHLLGSSAHIISFLPKLGSPWDLYTSILDVEGWWSHG